MAKKKYVPRGSSSPLSMTAKSRRKDADPLRDIRDGKEQKVKGQANVPTARQKQGAIELASSVVGGPVVGKLLGKAAGALASRAAASKAAPNVIRAGAPKPQPQLPKPKPIRRPDETSGPTIRAGRGDPSKGTPPAVRRPTTPAAARPKPKTPPKDKGKVVGLSPLGKGVIGGTLAAGTAAYLSQSEKDAKPAAGSQTPVNKEPTVNKMSGYELADDTNIRSPRKAAPKPASKPAPKKDDGYRFYGKKGTGLGDFSRKYDIKYATQEQFEKDFDTHDGEKRGGRPGKSKMKTQGLNRSKRTGFSGRGTGAALRGF